MTDFGHKAFMALDMYPPKGSNGANKIEDEDSGDFKLFGLGWSCGIPTPTLPTHKNYLIKLLHKRIPGLNRNLGRMK